MISVEEARERILSRVSVLGSERVDLPRALQRVLAEDIRGNDAIANRDVRVTIASSAP